MSEQATKLLIVDDDEVSREVLAMMAEMEGYVVTAVENGDTALVWLASHETPAAILTDLQMPGLTGNSLAAALRSRCGEGTPIIAMSGSTPKPEAIAAFDGFLLKPFTMDQMAAAFARRASTTTEDVELTRDEVLDPVVHAKLCAMMKPDQVAALFAMMLADADKRLATMREAVAAGDDTSYRAAAHAIKGGCGMVGAVELQRLARTMEETGLSHSTLGSLSAFVQAMARLRRMLEPPVA